MTKFTIISPDGFTIHPTETYTKEEIPVKFNEWKQRYVRQGYYSSVNYGRIQLDELENYCQIKKAHA